MEGIAEGMVVMQGGGNSLRRLWPYQTVENIMECLREVKRDRNKVHVAVVRVMRC